MEENLIQLEDGLSLLVFPHSYHHHVSFSDKCRLANLSFYITKNNSAPGPDYYSLFEKQLGIHPGFFILGKESHISEYIQKASELFVTNSPFRSSMQRAFLTLLFSELVMALCKDLQKADYNPHVISEKDFRMQNIQYFFIYNYNKDITLKQLAKHLELSEKQTGRLVQKVCGTDFQTHLSEIRLKNAKKFLKEDDLELQKVAEAVGYKSYNGFYLAFKKRFGITPLAYRKKYR